MIPKPVLGETAGEYVGRFMADTDMVERYPSGALRRRAAERSWGRRLWAPCAKAKQRRKRTEELT